MTSHPRRIIGAATLVGDKLSRARGKPPTSDKGGELPPLSFCDSTSELMHAYFDLPRFGLFSFGYANFEYAVFVGGFDAIRVRSLGQ